MSFLHRIFQKQTGGAKRNQDLKQVMISYEVSISFDAVFLVHFYDAENMPVLNKKKGHKFHYLEFVPISRSTVYFRVLVYNPLCLQDQTISISIKVRNELAVKKTFTISHRNVYLNWHSVKATLI